MPIIDFHVHTTSEPLWGLHTNSATIDDLRGLALKHQIEKMVLLATSFPLRGTGTTTARLIDKVDGDPLFAPFGTLNVEAGVEAGVLELDRFAKRGQLAGIKLYPGYQNFTAEDEEVFPVYELARSYNLPVIIHAGDLHECCPKKERQVGKFRCGYGYCPLFTDRKEMARPLWAFRAMRRFPTVKFVLAHLASPWHWELREIMNLCPNSFTDISGLFNSVHWHENQKAMVHLTRWIRSLIKKLPNGEDRILFATDFPIQSYEDTFQLVDRLCVSERIREKIFCENARFVLDKKQEV